MKQLFIFLFLIYSLALPAQEAVQKDPIAEAVVNLYSQLLVFPQEKVYVQTDRPYYLTGEKIYFRAFLINASKLTPATFSRYVYVELISPVDTVVVRSQIRIDEDKMFYGTMTIPESLPEGEYRIRSYTRYMENMGEPYFYTRSVFIADPKAAKLNAETTYDYTRQGQVGIKLRFKDAKSGEARYPKQFVIKMGNKGKEKNFVPGTNGQLNEVLALEEKDTLRTLLVDYKDGSNSFRKYIRIPYEETQPAISFYPEGGQLIAGTTNRVAFKALLPGGQTTDIKGSIYNSRNELQTVFSTQHEGMGSFCFMAVAGESYTARWEYNQTTTDVPLPKVSVDAMALQTKWTNDSMEIRLRKGSETTPGQYYLLIHRQGVPVYFQAWNFSKPACKLSGELFKTGVSHLVLLNQALQPLSERMVFNNRHDESSVEISANASTYHPRELVKLDIGLPNAAEDTISSTLALAVTDDKDVKIDTTTNIVAEVLLASELEGYIAHPARYFEQGKEREEAADLLMLTHGWRNYYVTEALQATIQRPKTKPEISQAFSGVLKKKSGRPYKNGKVQLTAVGCKYSEAVESDEQGRYEFSNFEFPDSTAYQFLSYTNEKTTDVEVCPDPILYPLVSFPGSFNSDVVKQELTSPVFTDYILKANRKYVMENGVRQVDLPEVTVRTSTKKKKQRFDNGQTITEPNRWISPDDIKETPPGTYEQLFYRIPGVLDISQDGVKFVTGAAKIIVNGFVIRYRELDQIIGLNEIAQVDVYTSIGITIRWANMRGDGEGPVIVITTWPSSTWGAAEGPKQNAKLLLPLGYQQSMEFYSPKYDSPEALNNTKADLRSTIYWKPNLKTNKDAKTSVEFYTADAASSYSIVLEGVGPGRKLIYCRKKALIKVVEKK